MNVFVASTFRDLTAYRDAARDVIRGLGHRAELVEPLAGVDPDGIAQLLRAILRTCHGCVLIVGSRRGSGPRDGPDGVDGLSYTMIEFLETLKANVPLVPFFLDAADDADEQERAWVRRFRDHVASYAAPVRVATVAEFAAALADRLRRLREQNPTDPSEREPRTIDRTTFRELFGGLRDGALEFITDANPRDVEAMRIKTQLQGYPRDPGTPAFKQADRENDAGWACQERGEYAAALVHYERALAVCPAFPLVWNNMGLAHYRSGDPERAKACFFNAVQLAPGFVKPWSNLAFLYWAGFGDADATRRWLDRALAIVPDYPDALVIETAMRLVAELGPAAAGEMDRRRVALLRRFPRETLLLQLPGAQAMMRGEHAAAVGRFELALVTAPGVVEFVDPLAECLCHLGRFAEAEAVARRAVGLDPGYASAWVNLSWACAGRGDWAACCDAAERALALDAFPETHDAAASNAVIARCNLGDLAGALAVAAVHAGKHPESSHAAALRNYVAGQTRGGR